MKLIAAITLFIISTSLFAVTPYSFKCFTGSDGKCTITNENSHEMKITTNGVYAGAEDDYRMYYYVEENIPYLFVYRGNTELAQAEGQYLAVPVSGGNAGLFLAESASDIPTTIQPEKLK